MTDIVNSPPHYTRHSIEPIDVIDDWSLGFYEAQVVKYLARAGHKGDRLTDIRKAKWYLDRLVAQESDAAFDRAVYVAEASKHSALTPDVIATFDRLETGEFAQVIP